MDNTGEAYDDDTKTDQEVAEQSRVLDKMIVDLDARDDGASNGGGSTTVV